MTKSIDFFKRALEKDPRYALAYAGLADSYAVMTDYGYLSPKEGLPRAKAYATKALELDNNLAEAHASLGNILAMLWDYKGAGKHLKIAIRLNPSYATAHQWYGEYLWYAERSPDGLLAEKLKAAELDPLSPVTNLNVGSAYYTTRQYGKAAEELRKTNEMFPGYSNAHLYLAAALMMMGEYEQSMAEVEKTAALEGDEVWINMGRGIVFALWGKTVEARKQIETLEILSNKRYVPPSMIGMVFAAMGDADQAFRWFDRAYEAKEPEVGAYLLAHPFLADKLGTDKRWTVLLQKLGVSP